MLHFENRTSKVFIFDCAKLYHSMDKSYLQLVDRVGPNLHFYVHLEYGDYFWYKISTDFNVQMHLRI